VLVFLVLDEGDRTLEIVALFAGDPELVALDGHLDLEFFRLDRLYDFLREFAVDALFDRDGLAKAVAARLFRLLEIEGARVHLALGHMAAQEFLHLLQLEIVIRPDHQAFIGAFNRAVAALEVIACLDLPPGALQRIVDLREFGAGIRVKARDLSHLR